jgi:hypothetical protein
MVGQSLSTLCIALLLATAASFVFPSQQTTTFSFGLNAKKKGVATSRSKGFGKAPVQEAPKPQKEVPVAPQPLPRVAEANSGDFLQSVQGGSDAVPTFDESVPVGDRTAKILRENYGLRTMQEQREEEKRQEKAKEQKKKLAEWKRKADLNQEFDFMAALPAPVLIFIDRFLKLGLAACTVLFVLAGGAIAFEAW